MSTILLSALIIVIGLMIGSFLNVCIYRIPLGRTIVRGRSYCTTCGKLIPWYCNIPVLSYLALRGRCKYCRAPILSVYPRGGAPECPADLRRIPSLGYSLSAVFAAALFSCLIAVTFIDLRQSDHTGRPCYRHTDPRRSELGLSDRRSWRSPAYLRCRYSGGLPAPVLLGLIFPDSLGGGDVKLMAAAGLFLGGS